MINSLFGEVCTHYCKRFLEFFLESFFFTEKVDDKILRLLLEVPSRDRATLALTMSRSVVVRKYDTDKLTSKDTNQCHAIILIRDLLLSKLIFNIQFKSKMKAGILSFYGMNIAKEDASAETTLE